MYKNHNPAITAAIRELKSELKRLAAEQGAGRRSYRSAQSDYDKKVIGQSDIYSLYKGDKTRTYVPPPAIPHDWAWHITALHLFYRQLRGTKRPHMQDAWKWYHVEGYTGIGRQLAYQKAHKWLAEKHPEAAKAVSAQPGVRIAQAKHDIPDVSPVVVELVAAARKEGV